MVTEGKGVYSVILLCRKKSAKRTKAILKRQILSSFMPLTETTLQSLTGKYREIQGKPCNENRDPAMRTGFPCNESRFSPVGIDLEGFPVSYTGFGFAV